MITSILFGIAVVIVYYLLPRKYRKILLTIASIGFYLILDWKMVLVLLLTCIWIWWSALYIKPTKKSLVLELLPLLLVLVFFKYNHFFITEAAKLLNGIGLASSTHTLSILMPLGISYYIFKSVSYLGDVYKGKIEAETSPLNILLYISFFPEITSGPISRYDHFKKALDDGMTYSEYNIQLGSYLIIKGVFMKAVIANRLANYVDAIFKDPGAYPGLAMWLGVFFFTIQLYCDFAGYSSIAIGITQLLGLHLQENFNRPYLAAGLREFWERWHISLSSWLRDYIYFPLGGSRCSKTRTGINLLIVFIVCGLWHGQGLHYLIWGLYHGILSIISRHWKTERYRGLRIFTTFSLVSFGWLIFRVETVKVALLYLSNMFLNLSLSAEAIGNAILPISGDNTCVAYFLVIMFFIVVLFARELYEEKKNISAHSIASFSWQVFLVVSILLFGSMRASSFIYANF